MAATLNSSRFSEFLNLNQADPTDIYANVSKMEVKFLFENNPVKPLKMTTTLTLTYAMTCCSKLNVGFSFGKQSEKTN